MPFLSKIRRHFLGALGLGLTLFLGNSTTLQAKPSAVPAIIQKIYDEAAARYRTNRQDNTITWQYAKACFDRDEFAQSSAEKARIANDGIAASRELIARDPSLAQGQYYLSMNLAQLARTKLMGAIPLLSEMEKGWTIALHIDPKMDYAGPDRYLGQLYRDAPGWPISLGDKAKGKLHLHTAVELCPSYPENYINLIESELSNWNEKRAAVEDFAKLQKILPACHQEFTGDFWAVSWLDWDDRLKKIEDKLGEK